MGTAEAAKRPARGVRNSITNYQLRITNFKLCFQSAVFLCALCSFAGNLFAQDSAVNQTQTNWIAEKLLLERTIQTGSVEQKRDALFRIRNLENSEASRVAIPVLTDKSEILRATAAFSVIFLPKDEAFTVLLPLLGDKREIVRRETAYALGKVGNPNAVNPLVQTFQTDKIADVKNACVVALGEIGDASPIEELIKILQRKPKTEGEFLRRSAARSVGQIAQIIQTGKREVQTPEEFLPEKYSLIEKRKHTNLFEIFPMFQTANDVLIKTLQNPAEDDDVKREAAFALGAIGAPSAIPVLQSNLDAKDYYLAKICAEALQKISASSTLTDGNKNQPIHTNN
ncbi:MAG: HEAT repeat domain-containing protein [Acidobacteriota bacterium]|nr:HEAT repeat domain-containing protein [Acidobacteriota bacterium]